MTEKEYAQIANLSRIRAALEVLNGVTATRDIKAVRRLLKDEIFYYEEGLDIHD